MTDDLISRQAVIEMEYDMSEIDGEHFTEPCMVVDVEDIQKLPPVKPQEPKTGHWIEKDGFDGDVYYDCSECGESWTTIEGTPWDNVWNYCPSCGARMVEPQERDHKCHTCKHYMSGEQDGSCDSYICKGYSDWESDNCN